MLLESVRNILFWYLGLVLIATACQKPVEDPVAPCTGSQLGRSIVQGQEGFDDNEISQMTVLITWKITESEKSSTGICTGTIVGKSKVLTAAHCLRPEGPSVKFKNHEVILTASPLCEKETGRLVSAKLKVKSMQVHPFYHPSKYKYDIATMIVDGEFPAWKKVAQLPTEFKLDPSKPLVVAGYGRTAYKQDLSKNTIRLRIGETVLISDQRADFILANEKTLKKRSRFKREQYKVDPTNDLLFIDQKEHSGICSGDSGGPLFQKSDEGWRLVGVASVVAPLDPGSSEADSCRSVGAHTNVFLYRDFILHN
jgi:secreted trypsin-like serine protease